MNAIARRLAWREVQKYIRINDEDWPDRLAPEDIATIHAWDGKSAYPDRNKAEALLSILNDEIRAGRLDVIDVVRKEWPVGFVEGTSHPDDEISRKVIKCQDAARILSPLTLGPYLKYWLSPFLAPRDETPPDAVSVSKSNQKTHKLNNQVRELDAVINLAIANAVDSNNYHAVWGALKELALSGVVPFSGVVDEKKGLEYTKSNEKKAYFSKNALRNRMARRTR